MALTRSSSRALAFGHVAWSGETGESGCVMALGGQPKRRRLCGCHRRLGGFNGCQRSDGGATKVGRADGVNGTIGKEFCGIGEERLKKYGVP